jgi:Leucine-rich repeat (LRR) protein
VVRLVRRRAPIGALRDLKTLAIDGNRKALGAGAIGELRRLETLQIESGPVLADLEGLGSLPELRAIEVIGTEIGSGPCSVAPLARLEHLRHLVLAGRPRSLKNLTDLDRLGELTSLERLRLDRIPDLASISWLRPLRRLRYLSISGTSIRDRDLTPIMDLPALTFLGLDIRGFAPGSKTYRPPYEEVLAPIQARDAASARRDDVSTTPRGKS